MVATAVGARTAAASTSGRLSMATTLEPPRAALGAREERERDVGAARPDVEQGQFRAMRGQRLDRRGASGRCHRASD